MGIVVTLAEYDGGDTASAGWNEADMKASRSGNLFTHAFIQQIFIEHLSQSLRKRVHVGMNKTWFLPP